VSIYGTFEPENDGPEFTAVVVPDVEVLDVLVPSSGGLGAGGGETSITLALTPEAAQEVVFSQEHGKIWLALMAPDSGRPGKRIVTIRQVIR
ncbi:MAG TPA: hypothetical protein VNP73_04940, partial [Actinomycetota bacterium]|nr:hypothetical protein [Actinomycetota bacterium]